MQLAEDAQLRHDPRDVQVVPVTAAALYLAAVILVLCESLKGSGAVEGEVGGLWVAVPVRGIEVLKIVALRHV